MRASAVLIAIDRPFAIGLYVRYFSHLEVLSSFFRCALDVYCPYAGSLALLEGNPHVRCAHVAVPLESIDLGAYDTVMVYATDQSACASRLRQLLTDGTPLFLVQDDEQGCPQCDPRNEALSAHFRQHTLEKLGHLLPNRLHLSRDEVDWGTHVLVENGLGADEVAIVMLDDASRREKLLRVPDHVAMIRHFCRFQNARIVCFDEKPVGKHLIYERLLDASDYRRMLFLRGLPLRRVIRVLASDRCRVVFGPATGLLHCASALSEARAGTVLAGYVGRYDYHIFDEWFWWGNSPVSIVLKTIDGARLLGADLANGNYLKLSVLPCTSIRSADIVGLLNPALIEVLGEPLTAQPA